MNKVLSKLKFHFGSRLPVILQTEVAECGLACIAMMVSYYGYQTDLLSLRRKFPVSLKGSRLTDLVKICEELNFTYRALKLELDDLKFLKTPCMLHWDMDHFVVLKQVKKNKVIIHDPAVGIVKYTMEEVSKHFTGVALEISPTVDFTAKKDRSKLYLRDLWRSVRGIKLILGQIVLLSLALEIFAIISPLFTQLITDHILVTNDYPLLYTLAIGFSLLMFIQFVTEYVRAWIILYLGNTLGVQLTANLLHHLFKLPIDFFEKRHMGDIVSKFGSVSEIQRKISTDFIEGILDGIMVFVTLCFMLLYSVKLSAIVIGALLIYIVVRILFYPTFKLKNQEMIVISAKENSIFMESIRAILPIKIFNKESLREGIWQNCFTDKLNMGIEVSKLGLVYRAINHLIFGVENILILVLGASLVMGNKGFSIGMLMTYLSYRGQFVGKAESLISKFIEYKMISIHLERVADIALTEPEKTGAPGILTHQTVSGSLQVENLGYRYSQQDPFVFQNINLQIKAGESVAIVGASGCGKTTLLKLLVRLFVPTEGKIYLDGIDLSLVSLKEYRQQIAAVMQDDVLMSGSIADNICFFETNPDMDRVYHCAKLAAIHDNIVQMPMGYQSLIGDMGTALSGGQKQRLFLARALYSNPKILFLDEATSHLDSTNESYINYRIKDLGITRVIIAHRKETVKIADRVINLEELIREGMFKSRMQHKTVIGSSSEGSSSRIAVSNVGSKTFGSW